MQHGTPGSRREKELMASTISSCALVLTPLASMPARSFTSSARILSAERRLPSARRSSSASPPVKVGDAQQLFLEERDAKRSSQDGFEQRMRIPDLLPSLAPLHVRVHHLSNDRSRPDDRHLDHEIIELVRVVPGQ